jgi:hypothetical protein
MEEHLFAASLSKLRVAGSITAELSFIEVQASKKELWMLVDVCRATNYKTVGATDFCNVSQLRGNACTAPESEGHSPV